MAALNATDDAHLHKPDARKGVVTLYAGRGHKRFDFMTAQLAANSLYFKKLFAEDEGHDGSLGAAGQETFEDADEFSMALMKHWIENRGKLAGPHDFHSLQHYLGLYCLAKKFEMEVLENQGLMSFSWSRMWTDEFDSDGPYPLVLRSREDDSTGLSSRVRVHVYSLAEPDAEILGVYCRLPRTLRTAFRSRGVHF